MTIHELEISGRSLHCVTASLQFAAPVNASAPFVDLPVSIYDARRDCTQRSLDRHGFVLASHSSAVSDFYDAGEVREIYYPEIARFVSAVTGASFVTVFTHSVRCAPKADQGQTGVQRPFKFVHNDYTATSGFVRAREALGAKADILAEHRFCIINVWRPIRGPVRESPLAVCDSQSVAKRDLVSVPSQDPSGRAIRIYTLAFNLEHRWSYFPMMQPDEMLLFKTFDSSDDGRARFTFHSAFTDPATPPDAAPRESIEVRALAVFG